jgi:hypothetical protein
LRFKIIGAPKNFKNWPCPLFRPKTNNTCHQKPNPSRETVLLIVYVFSSPGEEDDEYDVLLKEKRAQEAAAAAATAAATAAVKAADSLANS